jgi:hypothetical protein
MLAIFHDAGNGWVTGGVREHLSASLSIVLSVVVFKWNTLRVVMITSLLTVRTAWLGINN